MSWIATPAHHPYPWYLRLLFAVLGRTPGAVTEPMRLWARSPRVFLAFVRMWKALDRGGSPLEPSLRSLVQVRVAQIDVCPFCVDLNESIAGKRGVTREKLLALARFEEDPLFTERERAALVWAETLTFTGRQVGEPLRQRLRSSFTEDEIVELTALVAFQNMSAKFNFGLEIPPQGFCVVPPEAPSRPAA